MPKLHLLIIDDDEISREVLVLLANNAGYEVAAAESGDEAVATMHERVNPDVVLTDMQMPGLTGERLGLVLREICGPETRLLAMSASGGAPPGYDGFLTKPFSMDDLAGLLTPSKSSETVPTPPDALNETTFVSLRHSMGAGQIMALYTLCLDDTVRRIGLMRQAWEAADEAMFIREAHAIKGGCGMVGATELYHLAAAMEDHGFARDAESSGTGLGSSGTVLGSLDGFLAASERLRRILDAHS